MVINGVPLKIAADSVTIAVTTIANTPIPFNSAGQRPKYIMLVNATGEVLRIRPNLNGTETSATLSAIRPNVPLLLDVMGFTHLRTEQTASGGSLFMTPLENGGGDEGTFS